MKKSVIALGALTVTCLAAQPAYAKGGGTSHAASTNSAHALVATASGLSIDMGSDGRFNEGAYAGTSKEYRISFRWPEDPWSGYTTVRVNGDDAGFEADATPTPYQGGSQATDTVNGVKVTQQVFPVANPATGKNDTAMIKYTFKNTTDEAVTAGARVLVDTMIGDNDGAPFRVPGVGPVTTTRTWSGSSVPTSFQVFHDLSSADQIAEARFRGNGRTAPDKVESAYWPVAYGDDGTGRGGAKWDYATDGSDMTSDTAFLAYYNPKSLAPGASYSVAFSYGLGSATTNTAGALSVGLSGPATLNLNNDQTGYADSPFDAVGTIADSGNGPLSNVKVTLTLPPELSTTDDKTIALGTIDPDDADKQTTWSVAAAPQETAKDVSYSMTVTADGGLTKTVTRTVHLPAVQSATSSPTDSGSPTSSPTDSGSPTSSPTDSGSPTSTGTDTGSPTSTATDTDSPTSTASGTDTGSPTSTGTDTATSTVTGPPVVTDGSDSRSGWGPAAWLAGGLLLMGAALAGAGSRLRRR